MPAWHDGSWDSEPAPLSVVHDRLCLYYGEPDVGDCAMCGVIATVRADERENIARAIEALPIDLNHGDQKVRGATTSARSWAYIAAARIARNGGQ